jgi:hypothetical protein
MDGGELEHFCIVAGGRRALMPAPKYNLLESKRWPSDHLNDPFVPTDEVEPSDRFETDTHIPCNIRTDSEVCCYSCRDNANKKRFTVIQSPFIGILLHSHSRTDDSINTCTIRYQRHINFYC